MYGYIFQNYNKLINKSNMYNFIKKNANTHYYKRESIKNGLVASSPGENAPVIALLSNELKIHTTIVMPTYISDMKINSIKKYGEKYIDIVLYGDTYDESYEKALNIKKSQNKNFIYPFDDVFVIAKNNKIAYDIWNEYKNTKNDNIINKNNKNILNNSNCNFSKLKQISDFNKK